MKKVFLFSAVIILHLTLNIKFCGAQWEPDIRLTNDPEYSYTSYNNAWCIAANGNMVHTVWYDFRDGCWEIYYKRSTDGGTNWGADTRLTNIDSANSESPSIAVNGSIVHVVWQDIRDGYYSEIYYKRSTDGGINWGADTRLTNNPYGKNNTSIAVSGSNVHIVWFDSRDGLNGEIYYKLSTDGGLTWGADTRLTNNTAVSKYPSIVVSGSNVHIVWYDNRDGNDEIYFKRSTDGGINWGADIRLTNNTAYSRFPSIAVSGSIVNVVWEDERHGSNNVEIYYKRSTDNGISWGADTRLTNNTYSSEYPSITVSGLIVHIVWQDFSDGNWEIYYKRSSDGGINWGADTRLMDNVADSKRPHIAVSGSIVHVVWHDLKYGPSEEICYKRNPTGNVGIKSISTEIPTSFSLEQNYPNPFNPSTNIQFSIPNSGNVKLTVYNALGQEIQSLLNSSINAGTYSFQFNGKDLNSGFYFYKLELNTIDGKYYSDVKKLIMIK